MIKDKDEEKEEVDSLCTRVITVFPHTHTHTHVVVSTRYKLTSDDLVLAALDRVNTARIARQFVVMKTVPW